MQIECPNCNARYLAPDAKIGPNGRKVRCARCSHVWRCPPPPAPTAAASEAPPAAAPEPEPDRTVRIDPIPRNRMPAPPPPPPPKRNVAGWAFFVALVCVLVGGFFLGKPKLVELWPASAKLYELAGMSTENLKKDAIHPLTLSALETGWIEADGELSIVMRGVITNGTDKPEPAPFVRIRLFNSANDVSRDNREVLPGGELAPSEARGFAMRFSGFKDRSEVARYESKLEPVR